jgi:ribose transport system substrate-binding protein
MVAIWVHSNAQTNGVLRALEARGLNKKVLVVNFDGDEGVVAAIKAGNILVCGAQQPLEMGRKSVDALKTFFDGGTPPKSIPIPVLMLSQDNIGEMEAEAKRTVYLEENQL